MSSEKEATRECINCRRTRISHECGLCQAPLCKSCEKFLPGESFAYLPEVPAELSHAFYCPDCHQEHVQPALADYEEKLAQAREMYFFFNTQRSFLPVLKKHTEPIRVENCEDRDETILRLAFLSAQLGYNCVVEAEVKSTKTRNGNHLKHFWTGTAFPAELDLAKFERSTLGE